MINFLLEGTSAGNPMKSVSTNYPRDDQWTFQSLWETVLGRNGKIDNPTNAANAWEQGKTTSASIPEHNTPEHNTREHTETTRSAIHELRRISGLTWDQLARLFNVSRRSLHAWGSGQPLYPANEERLNRLLAIIRYIDRGAADLNRQALLTPTTDDGLPLDLLINAEYERVKQLLGRGSGRRKIKHTPLSPGASTQALWRPPPEQLVGTLHDTIHQEAGRLRVPRDSKGKK